MTPYDEILRRYGRADGTGLSINALNQAYPTSRDAVNATIRQAYGGGANLFEEGSPLPNLSQSPLFDNPFDKIETTPSQTQNLPLDVSNVQTPQSILPTQSTSAETPPQVNPLSTPQPQVQPTLGQTMNTIPAVTAPATPDVYELARLASGGINERNLGLVGGIIDAKNLYASAPEGTAGDAQRKQAHDYAGNIRKIAEMRQIPLGQFGEGNLTTEQANLALGNYLLDQQEQAQNQFLNVQKNLTDNYGESSNDHFWRLYDEYRQQGKGDRDATILAGRKTMAYQQELVENLNSAINDYGINGDSLNQFGMNMLGRLAGEGTYGSNAANVYANGFAKPLDNYRNNQEIIMENLRNSNTLARDAIQQGYYLDKATHQANLTGQLYEKQHGLSEQGKDADVDRYRQKKEVDLDTAKRLAEFNKSLASDAIDTAIEQRYENGKKLGLTGDLLTWYSLGWNPPSGTKNDNDTTRYKEVSHALNETAESLRKQRDDCVKQLNDDMSMSDKEKASLQQRIAKIDKQIEDTNRALNNLHGTEDNFENTVWKGNRPTGNFEHDRPLIESLNDWLYAQAINNPQKYGDFNDYTARQNFIIETLVQDYGFDKDYAISYVR